MSIWFDESKEPFKVTLLANATIAKYFQRKPLSKTQKIEETLEDGSIKLSIMISHEMEIMPLVKYWIPNLKVLEPLAIKEEIEKDLREYLG